MSCYIKMGLGDKQQEFSSGFFWRNIFQWSKLVMFDSCNNDTKNNQELCSKLLPPRKCWEYKILFLFFFNRANKSSYMVYMVLSTVLGESLKQEYSLASKGY